MVIKIVMCLSNCILHIFIVSTTSFVNSGKLLSVNPNGNNAITHLVIYT